MAHKDKTTKKKMPAKPKRSQRTHTNRKTRGKK